MGSAPVYSSVSVGALCFGMSMGLGPKLDLDAAAAENQAFMMTRTGERQEMVALNDRLAAYIEKARGHSTHTQTQICTLAVMSPFLSTKQNISDTYIYLFISHFHVLTPEL